MTCDDDLCCQVCGEPLRGDRPLVRCRRCHTPHHEDCWAYLGHCSTFGCPSQRTRPLDASALEAPESDAPALVILPEEGPPPPAAPSAPSALSAPSVRRGHTLRRIQNRPWSNLSKCRRFPLETPFSRGVGLTALAGVYATVFALLAESWVLGAILGVVTVACVASTFLSRTWLLVDKRTRTLQRYDVTLGRAQRYDLCCFEDVRSVRIRPQRGKLVDPAIVFELRDGTSLPITCIDSYSEERYLKNLVRDLARVVGVRYLTG